MQVRGINTGVVLIMIFYFSNGIALAEEDHGASHHSFHKNHLALIVGNTQDLDGHENGFSLGLDYEYRFNEVFGIGGTIEFAAGDFEHLLVAVPLFFHPIGNWRLILAPGTEFKKEEQNREWLVRIGIDYQFHLGSSWGLLPEFNIDFSEHETLLMYGISIGFGF